MKEIIVRGNLPVEHMNLELASPYGEAFEKLKSEGIFVSLACMYKTEEELGKAVTGAFTGFHIHEHLRQDSGDKEVEELMLVEMLGAYDSYDKDVDKSPYWKGLEFTLDALDFGDFYQKGMDYIIANKGEL